METSNNMETLTEELLNVKVAQLYVKWMQNVREYIDRNNPADLTYKICCCYHVFSRAAADYREIPYAVEIARYYTHNIIRFIEEQTGEKIQELADRINGCEGSIPMNLLYWCDVIDRKKEEIFEDVREFIYISTENDIRLITDNPKERLRF